MRYMKLFLTREIYTVDYFIMKQLLYNTKVFSSLGTWYTMSLVLFAGYFENPEISVDALSVW
ncbi:hypothetical protein Hanom_Chr17g01537531 [Helianthus anomalus]